MRKLKFPLIAACGLFLIGAGWIYIASGTLSPCGILKSQLQQQARENGSVFGALFSIVPDSVADTLLEGVYGTLTPSKCIGLLLRPQKDGPTDARITINNSGANTQPEQTSSSKQRLLTEGAESLARQAFDLCRKVSGRSTNGPYTLDDPCIGNALKAWDATGEIHPYAHPCFEKNARLDFLGRCL